MAQLVNRVFGTITETRQTEVVREITQEARINRDYIMLVIFSCVIATFGLVLNSGAVVIGGMLIAPLMSPIMGLALAFVRGDGRHAARSITAIAAGAAISVALSTGLGQLVSTSKFNFLTQLPTEVISRTQPTLFDLTIALAGGAAAAYAIARPELSATLPGVAIATALMPPLCVTGIGIAEGRQDVYTGSLLLFLSNFVAIIFAGGVIFAAFGFGPFRHTERRWILSRSFILSGSMLVVVAIPLVGFAVQIAQTARENQEIQSVLTSQLHTISADSSLVGFDSHQDGKHLTIVATVRTPRTLTYAEAKQIQTNVAAKLNQAVEIQFLEIPLTSLNTMNPPTPTPSPASTP